MDRTMTNGKMANGYAANDPHAPAVQGREQTIRAKKPDDENQEAWSIDDNDYAGGDPYNHTGSFCVPKFDD